jgi:hypothetical protein
MIELLLLNEELTQEELTADPTDLQLYPEEEVALVFN